jgi:hypothetical protein
MSKLLLTLAITLLLATPVLAESSTSPELMDFNPADYAAVTPPSVRDSGTAGQLETAGQPAVNISSGGAIGDRSEAVITRGTWGNPKANERPMTSTYINTFNPNVPPFIDTPIAPAQNPNNGNMHGAFFDDVKSFFDVSEFSYGDKTTTTDPKIQAPVKIKTTTSAKDQAKTKSKTKALPVKKAKRQLTEVGPAENAVVALMIALISASIVASRSVSHKS